MEIETVRATAEDIEELVRWRMEVIGVVFPKEKYGEYPVDLEEKNREYYLRAIPAGEHIAVFAKTEGKTVGCGGMCIEKELPSPDNPGGRCAYLMNIYCREEYRKNGVGEKVVQALVQEAQKQGIDKIYLESTKEATEFYKKQGFDLMLGMMHIPPR